MTEDSLAENEQILAHNRVEIENLKAEVSALRNEAAKFRLARNEALRQGHVLGTVLKAHNISFNIEDADYSNLNIDNGKVVGDYQYTPKKIATYNPPDVAKTDPVLTIDKIKEMSAQDIMKDYDNVMATLENSRN